MRKAFFVSLLTALFSPFFTINAQADVVINEANFPDKYFRNYVLGNLDLNGDGVLSEDEIDFFSRIGIYLPSGSISSLEGIEYFGDLTKLGCGFNNLTSLDVSGLTNLSSLDCGSNNLTSLDISTLTNLKTLYCFGNTLTTLDVSANVMLENLDCGGTNLYSLDVSTLTNLKTLNCDYNNLTTLDVSANTNLTHLDCLRSNLTTLDVSNLTNLVHLDCPENNLTILDVSGCTNLYALICYENALTTLDVSANANLNSLSCDYNNLTSLDVSNCANLERLGCGNNNLTSLDVSANANLKWLACAYNNLTTLDVSANPKLEELFFYGNGLIAIDLSNNPNIKKVESTNQGVYNTRSFDDVLIGGKSYVPLSELTPYGFDKMRLVDGTIIETIGGVEYFCIGECESDDAEVSRKYEYSTGNEKVPTVEFVISRNVGGGSSSIRDVKLDDTDGPCYNLNGQRVSRTAKGIVIRNGKKVVNR